MLTRSLTRSIALLGAHVLPLRFSGARAFLLFVAINLGG